MVAKAKAGPTPIHHKELSAQSLAAAIRFCRTESAVNAATQIARTIQDESGVQSAVESFHRHLPISRMQCDLLPDQQAVWEYSHKKKSVRLSKEAAQVLLAEDIINVKHLKS